MTSIIRQLITSAVLLILTATTGHAQISIIGGTTGVPDTTAGYQKWMMYRDQLAELSKGDISITPMVGGELGSEESIFNGVRRGRIQIANLSGLVIGTVVPEAALLAAPFLFDSEAQADHIYDTVLFDIYSDLLAEHGITFLSWDDVGFRQIYGKTPILVPEDLQGTRYRIPSGLSARLFAEAVGSDVIPLSFNENIIGLQTGLVDAGGNAVILYAGTGIAEEAPHLTLTSHIQMTNFVICSTRWLESLSPAQQDVIRAGWIPMHLARSMSRDEERSFLDRADEIGFTIHTLSDSQQTAWREAAASVTPKIIDSVGGRSTEIYQAIQDAKVAYNAAH